MADIVKRLNYYDHQFLRAPDFSDEQKYHLTMRRLHNSALHTWGIAQGLQVTVASGGTGTAVTVSAGVALDSTGREIVLAANTNLELGGAAAGTTLFITIAYDEQQSDPTTEAGGPGNTRVTEAPKLSFSTAAPADPSMTLILARVPRTNTGLGTVDASNRKQAGVVLGNDLTINTLTLKRDGVAQASWPVLSCSGANQATLANAGLSLNGRVSIGPAAGDRNLTVNVSDGSGVYANVKNANHEVLVGVDSTAILSAMTASDLQIRTNNLPRLTVQADGNLRVGPTVADRKLTVSVGDASGVYANVKNANHEVLVGVDSTAILSAMTNSDLQIRTNNLPRLTVQANTGKLLSPMWRATHVLNQRPGPMPVSGTFASGGGTLVIMFSGSGFASVGTNIGLVLQLDGGSIGTTRSFTNETSSHKAFTTNFVVQGNVAAGNHTITLSPLVNTNSDGNDWFNVTVLELPF